MMLSFLIGKSSLTDYHCRWWHPFWLGNLHWLITIVDDAVLFDWEIFIDWLPLSMMTSFLIGKSSLTDYHCRWWHPFWLGNLHWLITIVNDAILFDWEIFIDWLPLSMMTSFLIGKSSLTEYHCRWWYPFWLGNLHWLITIVNDAILFDWEIFIDWLPLSMMLSFLIGKSSLTDYHCQWWHPFWLGNLHWLITIVDDAVLSDSWRWRWLVRFYTLSCCRLAFSLLASCSLMFLWRERVSCFYRPLGVA